MVLILQPFLLSLLAGIAAGLPSESRDAPIYSAVPAIDSGYLLNNEIKATTRKATPAQNTLPVRNQTTNAIMPAGKMNRKTLARTMIITRPITRSRSKKAMSINGPKTTNVM